MSRLLVYLRGLHQPWLVLRTARDRASRHIITPLPTTADDCNMGPLLFFITLFVFAVASSVCNDVWYPLPNSTLGNIPPPHVDCLLFMMGALLTTPEVHHTSPLGQIC